MFKTVYVIILNYQSYEDTINYIKILNNQAKIDLKILIVDNCSPNGSFEILQKSLLSIKNIEIIQSEKNGGYAYGNNFGLKYIKDREFDYTLISNNDVILDNELLIYKMINKYEQLDSPAFVTPIMITNGLEAKNSAWKIPIIKEDIISSLNILKLFFKVDIFYDLSNPKLVQEVECIAGSFFLSSKNIFYDIGLFDEKTFLYGEERILAYKVKEKRLKNYLLKDLKYIHLVSNTISNTVSIVEMRQYLYESRFYFHKKYLKVSKIKLCMFTIVNYLSKIEQISIHFIKSFR
jgi:hypothetical protein